MPRAFGYVVKESTKEKIRAAHIANGHKPNTRVYPSKVAVICKVCQTEFHVVPSRIGRATCCSKACGAKSLIGVSPVTKGVYTSSSYGACHDRVRKTRGTPSLCEVCGTTAAKKFEWANLTGNYTDINDYKRMCTSCHTKFDGKISNITGVRV